MQWLFLLSHGSNQAMKQNETSILPTAPINTHLTPVNGAYFPAQNGTSEEDRAGVGLQAKVK